MAEEQRWISVVATGEATVAPDLAIVSFAVSGSGKQLAATRDDVNKRSSSVLGKLRDRSASPTGTSTRPTSASTRSTTTARASG